MTGCVAGLVLLFVFLLCAPAAARIHPKFSSTLERYLQRQAHKRATTSDVYAWVFFSDKGDHLKEDIEFLTKSPDVFSRRKRDLPQNLRSVYAELSEEAVERRKKSGVSIKVQDFPVHQDYLDEVKNIDGLNIRHVSRWLNAISVRAPLDSLTAAADLPFVERVELLPPAAPKAVDSSPRPHHEKRGIRETCRQQLEQIHAAELIDEGFAGQNISVLICDNGFRLDHIMFSDLEVRGTLNFVTGFGDTNVRNSNPNYNEHGTGTLSMLAGYSSLYGACGAGYKARLWVAATEDSAGEYPAEEDNLVAALEWGERAGVRLVSTSLGYDDWYAWQDFDGVTSPCAKAFNHAWDLGVVLVNSAGNSGARGITTPADAYYVISVGAVDSGNHIGFFSSHGPSADGRIKPELCARGVNTMTADAISVSVPGTGSVKTWSGTSFSAPLLAGGVAALMSKHPDWTNVQVREALLHTGTNPPKDLQGKLQYGYGIANIAAASKYEHKKDEECMTCLISGRCMMGPQGSCPCASSSFYEYDCSVEKIDCVMRCPGGQCRDGLCYCEGTMR
eukprot:CAMPEP_0177673568 /NCGR_PEP_ID=MMETSP0447-20121125/26027_1 /TAXON_ID=0 /ORGANISM="Stygamoeba regulata, Strain BSH-02190019" /LENGTH=560 /DNA_ID=CAMNT_0019181477 /DNA_START=93 /DNA_END=1772 /DNA_ORIENTATION=-